MARIAILYHERDQNSNYVIHEFARIWQTDGHSVFHLYGTKRMVPADILLMHVNLSVVPPSYRKFASHYPVVLNGKITDIRKSRISQCRLLAGDTWSGRVIVKADLNYGGWPEEWFAQSWIERQWPLLQRVHRRLSRIGQQGAPLYTVDYKILDSVRDVPAKWFKSRKVVVEKFLPETEGEYYHLRIHQVMGDRSTCTRLTSPEPIIKARRSIKAENIEPNPAVEQWRRDHCLDFGKIDYVLYEGTPVLLDINKTVGVTSGYRSPEDLEVLRRNLAEGLYDYLPPGGRGPF